MPGGASGPLGGDSYSSDLLVNRVWLDIWPGHRRVLGVLEKAYQRLVICSELVLELEQAAIIEVLGLALGVHSYEVDECLDLGLGDVALAARDHGLDGSTRLLGVGDVRPTADLVCTHLESDGL